MEYCQLPQKGNDVPVRKGGTSVLLMPPRCSVVLQVETIITCIWSSYDSGYVTLGCHSETGGGNTSTQLSEDLFSGHFPSDTGKNDRISLLACEEFFLLRFLRSSSGVAVTGWIMRATIARFCSARLSTGSDGKNPICCCKEPLPPRSLFHFLLPPAPTKASTFLKLWTAFAEMLWFTSAKILW